MGARDLSDPELQLGAGCLVDQLVGQFAARACGLGPLLDGSNVRATLAAILRHNRRTDLFGHFNTMRSFALADESALLMASFPRGRRPRRPFPYYAEVMTGFEYAAAVGMLQEGMVAEGLSVIAAVRARYDGRRRNPFDEAECGRHYARAMASWGAVVALSGFAYDATSGVIAFAATDGPSTVFWSTGAAWGTFRQRPRPDGRRELQLTVIEGTLRVETLSVGGAAAPTSGAATVEPGRPLEVTVGPIEQVAANE
jgi:hypothetical protein